MKVLHVTPGLESGGAEMVLYKLVSAMDQSDFENVVVSLTTEGPILGRRIREAGVALHALDFPRGAPNPKLLLSLAEVIRRERPQVVQTWMYHANVVGSLACAVGGRPPLVWGIHNAKLEPALMKRQTLRMITLGQKMAGRFPARITCSSEAAFTVHAELGYPAEKMEVIANGIDTEEFIPNPPMRAKLRGELGLSPDAPVVGMVARFMPQKDHATFFRAAGLLHRDRPDVHFVLCGQDVTRENPKCWAMVEEAGIATVTHLLGLHPDSTASLTAGLDVLALTSAFAESFGVALGEAMSCGVPCVTTAMEGPAALAGDVGWIVPIGDPQALAAAWAEMLSLTPEAKAEWAWRARRRIVDHFSLRKMADHYADLYRRVAAAG